MVVVRTNFNSLVNTSVVFWNTNVVFYLVLEVP
jgi:hypothetical protein